MARKSRVHYPGAFYHVIARGNKKERVFEDDRDKKEYRALMTKYIKQFNAKLFAYVIMDNHIHLLIQVDEIPLSKIMQLIQQTYTAFHNRRYKESGHVFEQRYKAILCDKDAYLIALIRYIHQNPARANIGDINYPWSSHSEYLKGEGIICAVDEALGLFSDNKKSAMARYRAFVLEIDDAIKEKREFEFEPDEIINDSVEIDLEKSSIDDVVKGFVLRENIQVEYLMKKKISAERMDLKAKLMKEILKKTHCSQRQVADYFMMSEMSISRYLKRG